jgi:hypothetical protein
MTSIPYFEVVDDPIAEDTWSYRDRNGESRLAHVTIGRPRPWPGDSHGDWLCPVQIDDYMEGVRAIAGVGPVDALMNAMGVIQAFADEIGRFEPRASAK